MVNKTSYLTKQALLESGSTYILADKTFDLYKNTCKSGSVDVDNCKWGLTYNTTTGAIDYCSACDENFYPLASSHTGIADQVYDVATASRVLPSLFTSCTESNASTITNCAYMGLTKSLTADAGPAYICYACMEGFMLNNAGTNCESSTEDDKCMQVDTNGKCSKCWWPFWFLGDICSSANLVKVNSLIVIALVATF